MSKIFAYTGNQIIARGALDAGCTFFAGYPISPSSEIASEMARELPLAGGVFIQMEDEIASMGATIAASLTGRKSMTATSGPGFSLKQENFGFACITEIPCVIVNVMRLGPSTGIATFPAQGDIMQSRWGTHGDHPVIVLAPSTHREIYDETIRAFNLSEKYRQPVILLSDEILAQMSSRIEIPEREELVIVNREKAPADKKNYKPFDSSSGLIPPLANFFQGYRFHITGLTHDDAGSPTENTDSADRLIKRLHAKINENLDDILKWVEFMVDDAEILLVAIGSIGRSAQQAVIEAREKYGIKVGLFRPLTLWPFPEDALRKVSAMLNPPSGNGRNRIIVVEMNEGQLALEVERVLHRDVETLARANGVMISPAEILCRLTEGKSAESKILCSRKSRN